MNEIRHVVDDPHDERHEDQGDAGEYHLARLTPWALAAISLIPRLGQAVAGYFRDEHARRGERVQKMILNALEELQEEVGAFASRLEETPARRRLFNEAIQGAYETQWDEQLRWFAHLLSSGLLLSDDAQVDQKTRLVQTASRMEPSDLKALYIISTPASAEMRSRNEVDQYVNQKELEMRFTGALVVIDAITATLTREGLVIDKSPTTYDVEQPMWAPTRYGRLFLTELEQFVEQ